MGIKQFNRGLTLIEVVVGLAFVSVVYVFIVQTFLGSYTNINMGDVQTQAVLLAKNKIRILSSFKNPLYIGLNESDINDMEAGNVTALQLKERGTIVLNDRAIIGEEETTKNSEDIKNASTRVDFVRKTEWSVEDVYPVLVHVWITVAWSDPKKEIKADSYTIETLLSP
jgi:type II secretory pathway pseudopilin PulG